MKKNLRNIIGKETMFLDGAMGTLLQAYGLKPGELPESFNISHPEILKKIHMDYISAGSDIITLNTFGAFSFKYPNLEDIVRAAVNTAAGAIAESRQQSEERDIYIAFDMGPTGKLLKPFGDLSFEECYDIYKQSALLAQKHGADLIIIETMSDTYEIKAALLAVKENTSLPVICSLTFDTHGRTMTGCDFRTMITLLEGLGVDAIGINCGYGPDVMKQYIPELMRLMSVPLLVQPNAGLPEIIDGRAVYSLTPVDFAGTMREIHEYGACLLGGCCGTDPAHIREMINVIKAQEGKSPARASHKGAQINSRDIASSYSKSVDVKSIKPVKPITDLNIDDIIDSAYSYIDDGAELISIDLSASPNQEQLLVLAVLAVQEITGIPLHIISSDAAAIENALRIYNGKCALSISGCSDSDKLEIEASVKKYGAAII